MRATPLNVMKNVMNAAGVDTLVYKGGSGRSAGSSAAKVVDLLHVMATARWSSFETFKKFNLRVRLTEQQRCEARNLD